MINLIHSCWRKVIISFKRVKKINLALNFRKVDYMCVCVYYVYIKQIQSCIINQTCIYLHHHNIFSVILENLFLNLDSLSSYVRASSFIISAHRSLVGRSSWGLMSYSLFFHFLSPNNVLNQYQHLLFLLEYLMRGKKQERHSESKNMTNNKPYILTESIYLWTLPTYVFIISPGQIRSTYRTFSLEVITFPCLFLLVSILNLCCLECKHPKSFLSLSTSSRQPSLCANFHSLRSLSSVAELQSWIQVISILFSMSGAAGPIAPNLGSKFGESAGWCASLGVSQRGLIMRYNDVYHSESSWRHQ